MEHYLYIILKFCIGYITVILHLNYTGKIRLSDMTPIDFIGNFIIGGIIGGVIYNNDITITEYCIVLVIGILLIELLNFLCSKINILRSFAIGRPIPIIQNGKFIIQNIKDKKNKIDILNVLSQLHKQGIYALQEIKFAQIEPSGGITAICKDHIQPSKILVQDGQIDHEELKIINKTEDWLKQEIDAKKIDISKVFIAEYYNNKLYFIMLEGKDSKFMPPTS